MKFYTCNYEYDEVYYDTRVRMETVCREENEKWWGNTQAGCYIAVSKITYTIMTIVVAASDVNINEKKIIAYIQEMLKIVAEKIQRDRLLDELEELTIKEVTLNAFMTAMRDNALNRLFSDKSLFLEKIGLLENGKCFKEYLLDVDYWDKEKKGYIAKILPKEERERIAKGKRLTEPTTQPVHYVIYENNPKTAKIIVKELLHYLCIKGRICNRRLVKIEESDFVDVIISGKIQNLNTLDGGTVVVYFEKADKEAVIEELLSSVYDDSNNYSRKYTAVVVFPSDKKTYHQCLRNCCLQWPFVEVHNKPLGRQGALAYFQELIEHEEVIADYADYYKLFNDKEIYTQAEVLSVYRMWYRNNYNISNNFKQYEEVVNKYFDKVRDEGNAREELEQLIGLDNVKVLIKDIVNYFKLQKIRSKDNSKISRPSMHMVFYGNPGTAKTTVARLVGKILKEEKIIEKGEFFEVGRADLVGKYVGWTAKTVKEHFEKAKGSVLFIDEAYSLVDEQNSFGDEAINTIVQEMENHREDVVVIMAGYKADMEKLLHKNQGLSSRVSFYVDFPDYSNEELYSILNKLATQEGFTLEDSVKVKFFDCLKRSYTSNGNGRLARNLLERAKIKQAGRVLQLPISEQKREMMCIKDVDFV